MYQRYVECISMIHIQ